MHDQGSQVQKLRAKLTNQLIVHMVAVELSATWRIMRFFFFFFLMKCAGVALSDQQTPNPTVFPPVQIHPGIQIDFMTLSASHPMATYFQSWNRSQVQLMMRSFLVCATLWIIWVVWTDLSELNRMREDADDS